jgi:putative ABC transport system permease protein
MASFIPALKNKPVFLGETWSLALQALRANKIRAMLTMLGVIIGSACIVLVVTVALTAKRYIVGQIEAVGSNLIVAEALSPGADRPETIGDQINPGDLDAVLRDIPQVVQAAGTHDIAMSVTVDGQERPVNLVGVTDGFQEIRKLLIIKGRYFDQDDMLTRAKVCLLTQKLADLIYPNEDPVGKDIRIGDLHFSVIGVFRERVSTFGLTEITPESLIIPFPLIKDYTATDFFKSFYAQGDSPENVDAETEAISQLLESRHRPGAKYRVQNLSGILQAARYISMAMTGVLIITALIALTISGIGIMNIMLVTVTERTREIGIRKAIGAPRDAILYQFLMEAIMISGTGAIIGIAIALAIPAVLNFVLTLVPEAAGVHIPVSGMSVIMAFLVSCSTGLLFGFLPANRAARLHPTESLRYE